MENVAFLEVTVLLALLGQQEQEGQVVIPENLVHLVTVVVQVLQERKVKGDCRVYQAVMVAKEKQDLRDIQAKMENPETKVLKVFKVFQVFKERLEREEKKDLLDGMGKTVGLAQLV